MWKRPWDIMAQVLDCGLRVSERVQTPITLLHSLSDRYSGERYELLYPPAMG